MKAYRQAILETLRKELGIEGIELSAPPNPQMGDVAFPTFGLAKSLRKNPNVIALELASKIKPTGIVKKIIAQGPYLNFFVDRQKLGKQVLKEIEKKKERFGYGHDKKQSVLIEYPAPNTNKPLHLGHIRNMLLGNAMVNLLKCRGDKVVAVDLVNDRGVHICKSMLAYKKWGHNEHPDKKGDHFVGDFYVLYSQKEADNPELAEEVQKMLVLWEANDPETITLWKKMRKWALDGFKETYKTFNVKHERTYYESEIYQHGQELIMDGLRRGVFQKDENGAVIADLETEGLGKKVLLRQDGTGIYITQDIYLAKLKFDEFKIDRSVYIVANEQDHHFKVLFKVLKMLGFAFADRCRHLSYGMIYLPEGRMKSREGTVVDADELVAEMKALAAAEIKKRHTSLSAKDIEKRSDSIGMGALKYFILKYDSQKDFTYDPSESISFEGETGPYIQYAHARICSILRKVEGAVLKADVNMLTEPIEEKLIMKLDDYCEVVADSAEHYRPNLLAKYLLELAQLFNVFYHEEPVLSAEPKLLAARLHLAMAVKQVISNGLFLLGIDAPEQM